MSSPPNHKPPLVWELDVSLINNRRMMASLAKMFWLTGLIMFALVGGLVAINDGPVAALKIGGMILAVVGGLAVLSLLVMVVFFRNHMRMRFEIDDAGVRAVVTDRRARAANRVAAIAGVLGGKPGAAGAGLLAMDQEERSAVWSAVAEARFDPTRHTITLRNVWRPLFDLFCTPETYDEAARRVATGLASSKRPARPRRNPLWAAFGLTALIVVSILPLFGMPYPFEPDPFPVIFTLCFALATVWLIPLLGWPALGGVAWILAVIVGQGGATHGNQFNGATHSGFESLIGAEWIGFGAALLGLSVLAGIAVGALTGKVPSVLMADEIEMESGETS